MDILKPDLITKKSQIAPLGLSPEERRAQGYPSEEYCDLLIIDEMLPCDFSPFRSLEYSHYLDYFSSSLLLSTEGWHGGFSNLGFFEQLSASSLPENVKQKIRPFSRSSHIIPKLAYITFLNNAWLILPYLAERKIPFILQLYPGGGFEINAKESDARLRQIAESPLCRKIIVTQTVTRDYLIDKIGCDSGKVEFIYGGVYNTDNGFDYLKHKKLFGRDKTTLDICFVAHRYGDDTKKKGYDQFIAVAKGLSKHFTNARFHVVGDYTPDQISLENYSDRFTFHGKKPQSFFQSFYPEMDIILSVNRPLSEGSGAFDGFPTGACMEAGFAGVLNCISDPLGMNIAFENGKDIIIVDLNADDTIKKLTSLLSETNSLYELSYQNWLKFLEVFDTDNQLWRRCKLITQQLLEVSSLIIRPSAKMSALDLWTYERLLDEYKKLRLRSGLSKKSSTMKRAKRFARRLLRS